MQEDPALHNDIQTTSNYLKGWRIIPQKIIHVLTNNPSNSWVPPSYMLYTQHLDKLLNASITHFRRLNSKWNNLYILLSMMSGKHLKIAYDSYSYSNPQSFAYISSNNHWSWHFIPKCSKGNWKVIKNKMSKNIHLFMSTTM